MPNLKETIFRFPIPVAFLFIFTISSILNVNIVLMGLVGDFTVWFNVLLVCGFFAFTALKLFIENHSISKKQNIILNAGLAFFLLYICFSPSAAGISLFFTGFILLLFVAAYIFNDMGEAACCHFNTRVFISVFFAFLSAFILCVGLSLVFLSVDSLFNIRISGIIYSNVWLVGMSFFAPFYALSGFPKDFESKEKEHPKGIAFIFSYILAPLIVVYFAILYAYIAKILIEWELPNGKVAYMVLAFGIIGIITHIFSYPLKDTGTRFIKLVYRYFYYALLAPIALLFIGIAVRIKDYGITEDRYVVVLLAVWFLFSAIYFIFKKEPKLKVIIIMISSMFIISSFGIWGADSVSGRSQAARLKHILEENNLLVNGVIKKADGEVEEIAQKEIISIVTYLSYKRKENLIKDWFPPESYINTTSDKRLEVSKIIADIGVKYSNNYRLDATNEHFYFLLPKNNKSSLNFFDINGFDYYTSIGYANLSSGTNWSKTITVINDKNKTLELRAVRDGILLVKYPEKDISLQFDLLSIVKSLYKDKVKSGAILESQRDLFILTNESKGLKVRVYIENISGNISNDEPVISGIDFAIAVQYPKN